jgi:hypothetical protein
MDMHAAICHWGMAYSKGKRVGLRACVCECKAVVYSLPYLRSGAATNDTSLPLHPSSLPTSILLLFIAQRWSFFWATLCGRDRGSGACAKSLSCCRKCGTCSSVSRIGQPMSGKNLVLEHTLVVLSARARRWRGSAPATVPSWWLMCFRSSAA